MKDGSLQSVAGICTAGDAFIAERLICNVLTFSGLGMKCI